MVFIDKKPNTATDFHKNVLLVSARAGSSVSRVHNL